MEAWGPVNPDNLEILSKTHRCFGGGRGAPTLPRSGDLSVSHGKQDGTPRIAATPRLFAGRYPLAYSATIHTLTVAVTSGWIFSGTSKAPVVLKGASMSTIDLSIFAVG